MAPERFPSRGPCLSSSFAVPLIAIIGFLLIWRADDYAWFTNEDTDCHCQKYGCVWTVNGRYW